MARRLVLARKEAEARIEAVQEQARARIDQAKAADRPEVEALRRALQEETEREIAAIASEAERTAAAWRHLQPAQLETAVESLLAVVVGRAKNDTGTQLQSTDDLEVS